MNRWNVPRGASLVLFALLASIAIAAHAKGDLRKVNHVKTASIGISGERWVRI
jgi:hypothetical protein